MNEVKIPFGQSADGRMVSIDDATVARGLACNCFCAACNAPLVARKGEINQHHFAHFVEPENCAEARETALHKFAKAIICEALDVHLPDNLNLGVMQSAKPEEWLDGIRPDVLAQFDEPVAIEIFVAHKVPIEKLQKLTLRKLATLEIDLSRYHNNGNRNEEQWRDLILRTAPRFWLFQPAIVREKIEREEREAAEQEAKEWAELAQEIQRRAERREWIEARRREEQEWQRLVTESNLAANERKQRRIAEKEAEAAAELEYQAYQEHLEALQEDQFLEGLKICADTKRHLEEWERRKRQPATRSAA